MRRWSRWNFGALGRNMITRHRRSSLIGADRPDSFGQRRTGSGTAASRWASAFCLKYPPKRAGRRNWHGNGLRHKTMYSKKKRLYGANTRLDIYGSFFHCPDLVPWQTEKVLLPVKEMTVPAIRQQAGRMLPESGSVFDFWQCILILWIATPPHTSEYLINSIVTILIQAQHCVKRKFSAIIVLKQ